MKYLGIIAALGLSACMQTTTGGSQPNPGLPIQACFVSGFASDTGDAEFIRGNRGKEFIITSTPDGFVTQVTSKVFSDSSTDFAVTRVTADQIFATQRGQSANSSLNFTLVVDRTRENGIRRVVQTMQVDTSTNPRGYTQNQWFLNCVDAG